MNPVCVLVELEGWRDFYHLRQRLGGDGYKTTAVDVQPWLDEEETRVYRHLARCFFYPAHQEPPSSELKEIADSFVRMLKETVVRPLRRLCSVVPDCLELRVCNEPWRKCAGHGNSLSLSPLAGVDAEMKRASADELSRCHRAMGWRWSDFFCGKDSFSGKAVLEGETVSPSFEQWDATTLSSMRRVGDTISEVQKDLMLMLNNMGEGNIGLALDSSTGGVRNSLWPELVRLIENAFNSVVSDIVELILWCIQQSLLGEGVFSGRPMFTLKAFWHYSSRRVALSPSPAEVHERLMKRVKKELIWNVVPEFGLHEMVKRELPIAARVGKTSLRNRLMEEGSIKRMWDSIHFTVSRRCDELQETLRSLTEAYAFYFSNEKELPRMTYQRLWEIRKGLKDLMVEPLHPVESGVFAIHQESLHQVATEKVETIFRMVEGESKYASTMNTEAITGARWDALRGEGQLGSLTLSLNERLDQFHHQHKMQGKYSRGLDPMAHISRFVKEQKDDENRIRSELKVLLSRGRTTATVSDVAGIAKAASTAITEEITGNTASGPPRSSSLLPSDAVTSRVGSSRSLVVGTDALEGTRPMNAAATPSPVDVKALYPIEGDSLPPRASLPVTAPSAQEYKGNERPPLMSSELAAAIPRQSFVGRVKGCSSASQSGQHIQFSRLSSECPNRPIRSADAGQKVPERSAPGPANWRPSSTTAAMTQVKIQKSKDPLRSTSASNCFVASGKQDVGGTQQVINTTVRPASRVLKQQGTHTSTVQKPPSSPAHYTGAASEQEVKTVSEGELSVVETVSSDRSTAGPVSQVARRMSDATPPTADPAGKAPVEELVSTEFNITADQALVERVRAFKKLLPFVPDMPCEGIFIEDINLSNARLEASINRMRAVRGCATVLCNYREIALVEDSVCEVVESLAQELATATCRILARFPFLEGRVCGVLLANLQVLETDEEFQSLYTLYRSLSEEKRSTESVECCLRARAQALAKESPYVVPPERYNGHVIVPQVVGGGSTAGASQCSPGCFPRGHQTGGEGPYEPLQGGAPPVPLPGVAQRSPRSALSKLPMPSPPAVAAEGPANAMPQPRFVRNIHVHEDRETDRCDVASRGSMLCPATISTIQVRRSLSPDGNRLSVGRLSGSGDRSLANSRVPSRGVACHQQTVASAATCAPRGAGADEISGTSTTHVNKPPIHPLSPMKNYAELAPSRGGVSQWRSAPSNTVQEAAPLAQYSRVGEAPHGVGETSNGNALPSAGKTGFFENIERGLMDERIQLQELEAILKQAIDPKQTLNDVKARAQELGELRPMGKRGSGQQSQGLMEQNSQPSDSSVSTGRLSASSQSRWAAPSPSLLFKAKSAPLPPSSSRLNNEHPTAPLQRSLAGDANTTQNQPHSTADSREGVGQGIVIPPQHAGGGNGCPDKRGASEVTSADSRTNQRDGSLETTISSSGGVSAELRNTQLWYKGKQAEEVYPGGVKTISNAVVKSSWGTVTDNVEEEQDRERLPSVPHAFPWGKLGGLLRKPQTPQNGRAPWGRFTLSAGSSKNITLPNALSGTCSTPQSREGESSVSSPFPSLGPTATTDMYAARVQDQEAKGLSLAGLTFRQRYIEFCRQGGIKPNSMLMRLFPDKQGISVMRIDTSMNYVGPKGFYPILQALRGNAGLEYLNLSHNNLENDEVVELVNVLLTDSGASLVFLDLSNNPVSLVGGAALLRLAQSNPLLSTIRVKGTLIPQQVCRTIQEACDANTARAQ